MTYLAKKSVSKSDQQSINKTRGRSVKRLSQKQEPPWIETNSVCAVAEKKLFEKDFGKYTTSLSPTKSKNYIIVSVEKPFVNTSYSPKILENKVKLRELLKFFSVDHLDLAVHPSFCKIMIDMLLSFLVVFVFYAI